MKAPIFATLLLLLAPSFSLAQAAPQSDCARCQAILADIHRTLSERCASAPAMESLRKQPVYLFLSIFDEVSGGIDATLRGRIYRAALDGMHCDNLDAGVEAAQRMSAKLMRDNRT